jgi:hypothetical protein
LQCDQARHCTARLPDHETNGLTVDERLKLGDEEAIYDAVVEAIEALDGLREMLGVALWADSDAARELEVIRARKQETAATDRGWREPQRSGRDRK